jgi:hypothetical protein
VWCFDEEFRVRVGLEDTATVVGDRGDEKSASVGGSLWVRHAVILIADGAVRDGFVLSGFHFGMKEIGGGFAVLPPALVAGLAKAIQSFRLRLHSGLRQRGRGSVDGFLWPG